MEQLSFHWILENPILGIPPQIFFYGGIVTGLLILSFSALNKKNGRGIPARVWFSLLSYSILLASLVSGVSHFLLLELGYWKPTALLYSSHGHSFFGWVGGIALGVWSFLKWNKLPFRPWPAMTFAWIIGLLIVRIGCLSGGCCFGIPWSGSCSLRYGSAHSLYHTHQQLDLLPPNAHFTLILFPSQLLEITFLGVLALTFFFLVKKSHWFSQKSLFVTLWIYGCFRLFTDSFRDGGRHLLGFENLHNLQMILLPFLLIGLYFLVKYKNNLRQHPNPPPSLRSNPPSMKALFILWIVVCFALALFHTWLRPGDVLLILGLQLLSIAFFMQTFFCLPHVSILRKVLFPIMCGLALTLNGSDSTEPPLPHNEWQSDWGEIKQDDSVIAYPYSRHGLGGWGEVGAYPNVCGGTTDSYRLGLNYSYTRLYKPFNYRQFHWNTFYADYPSGMNSWLYYSRGWKYWGNTWNIPVIYDNYFLLPHYPEVIMYPEALILFAIPHQMYLGPRNYFWLHYKLRWDSELANLGLGFNIRNKNTKTTHYLNQVYMEMGVSGGGFFFQPVVVTPNVRTELFLNFGELWRIHIKTQKHF